MSKCNWPLHCGKLENTSGLTQWPIAFQQPLWMNLKCLTQSLSDWWYFLCRLHLQNQQSLANIWLALFGIENVVQRTNLSKTFWLTNKNYIYIYECDEGFRMILFSCSGEEPFYYCSLVADFEEVERDSDSFQLLHNKDSIFGMAQWEIVWPKLYRSLDIKNCCANYFFNSNRQLLTNFEKHFVSLVMGLLLSFN